MSEEHKEPRTVNELRAVAARLPEKQVYEALLRAFPASGDPDVPWLTVAWLTEADPPDAPVLADDIVALIWAHLLANRYWPQ